jgi:hypothetical protein
VAESRAEQDGLDPLLLEHTPADCDSLGMVLDNGHIQLRLADVDKTAMFILVRIWSVGEKERFKNRVSILHRSSWRKQAFYQSGRSERATVSNSAAGSYGFRPPVDELPARRGSGFTVNVCVYVFPATINSTV